MDDELKDFTEMPDKELTGNTEENTETVADIFNSAGNTRITNDDTELKEDKQDIEDKSKFSGKLKLGKLISGTTTVNLVNIFIPSVIVFMIGKAGYKAKKNQLKLTTEEKEILSPVVQDCLNYIEINFDNPFYALAFVASMIYGAKIFDVVPELSKVKDDMIQTVVNIPDEETDNENESSGNNTVEDENSKKINEEYAEIRKKVNSTTIRADKNKVILDCIVDKNPSDIIEMFKVYGGIYPERNENYFRKWYSNNYEIFPENLKFL